MPWYEGEIKDIYLVARNHVAGSRTGQKQAFLGDGREHVIETLGPTKLMAGPSFLLWTSLCFPTSLFHSGVTAATFEFLLICKVFIVQTQTLPADLFLKNCNTQRQ